MEEVSGAEAAKAVGAWVAHPADLAVREADTALAAAVKWVVLVVADSAAALKALAEAPAAEVVAMPDLAEEPPADVLVMLDLVGEQPVVPDPLPTATSLAGFLACPLTRGYRMAIPRA